MKNKINFISGETYTLAELFSGNRKIVIPDLQRDYCWGDSIHTSEKKDLVNDFVNNLIAQFDCSKQIEDLNLGLIYGYEFPENYIQLCDGQQRITTLYLLLGMLNRKTEGNLFRHQLISDYEFLLDDKEPYLQYSIRESSLYFISDLVCHVFIKQENDKYFVDDIKSIRNSSWFFNEYNYDPSIQSMLKALSVIELILENRNKDWCKHFGEFIISKLTFLYYDLETRENGEETFVVINTTGEPLSSVQNLKPLICIEEINKEYNNQNHSISEDWEEIETWFWQHRKGKNDTADAGFNEFMRWVTMLNSEKSKIKEILSTGKYSFPKEKIPFKEIYSYWQVVKFLFEDWNSGFTKNNLSMSFLSPSSNNETDGMKCLSQIDCFLLLPLIAYCKKWNIIDSCNRNLYRLYQFILNLTRIDNVRKAVNELVSDVISIAEQCEDIIDLIDKGTDISTTVLTQEELIKLKILHDCKNKEIRSEIEELFWRAQSDSEDEYVQGYECHKIWSGEILPLIEWASYNGNFCIGDFEKYLKTFDETFKDGGESIDEVRRALLTRNLNDYPRIFRGGTVYSFAWEWSDWKSLINDNKKEFKNFFDDLNSGISCLQMIDNFPEANNWAEFVKIKELMSYCSKKNMQYYHNAWYLMKKERWSAEHANINAYKFYLYLLRKQNENLEWKLDFWPWDDTCVYFDQQTKGALYNSLDIIWNSGEKSDKVEIDVFIKPTDNKETVFMAKNMLKPVELLGYSWVESKYCKYLDMYENNIYDKIEYELNQLFDAIGSIKYFM